MDQQIQPKSQPERTRCHTARGRSSRLLEPSAASLLALNETHALSGPELHTWCREKGLFEHQLHAWREAFCTPTPQHTRESNAALRELQNKCDKLQRELTRKERALAETAALLVLQKKYQSLWEGEEK